MRTDIFLARMNEKTTDGQKDEQTRIKLYMELTGATEVEARNVIMSVEDEGEGKTSPVDVGQTKTSKTGSPPSV
jgi:hypothetical protein